MLRRTALLAAFVNAALQAQIASISGLVTDSSGAVIPDARITGTNTETNVPASTVTSAQGLYTLPQLPPGPYSIKVEAQGFSTVTRSGLVITVGQVARVDFELQPGAVATTVEVAAAAPALESETSSIGQLVDSRRVQELPLRGRNPYSLVTITPGARVPITWQELPVDVFTDAHAVINGARGDQNEFLFNGIPNSNSLFGGPNLFPSVESVQEFKVETNNYSAEFGRAAGGIFNVVTKSGTNNWHGSLFEFHRNENINANDFFQNRAGRP